MNESRGVPSPRTWRLVEADGLLVGLCGMLESVPGVAHGFSTRRIRGAGGTSGDFDLGEGRGSGDEVEQRRRRLCRAVGFAGCRPWPIRQVHGADLIVVAGTVPVEVGARRPAADGVLSLRGDTGPYVPGVRTADCVPILIADRRGTAVAALHAGWRGTAAGIVARAVERLNRAGSSPATLLSALGPAIGACCYAVGPEVIRAVAAATPGPREDFVGRSANGAPTLDLRRALAAQLRAAGLEDGAIATCPWCTSCREDLFFSHRRDGKAAGRMMAVIGQIRGLA